MKESEAKQKWCPMKRVIVSGGAGNWLRGDTLNSQIHGLTSNCIGSACMMWEDHTPDKVVLDGTGNPLRLFREPPADDRCIRSGIYKPVKVDDKWEFHRISDEQYGDCGLKAKESGCFYPG